MAAPRPAVNGATTSVGFTAKLVIVQSVSVDGKSAVCVDRQRTQVTVPMLVQPSKGLLPAVGETWLVTQALGHWTFTAIVASSVSQFQQISNGSGVAVSNTPPASPASGDLWINPSMDNLMSYWNGTNWVGLQMGAVAIQPGSLTHVQLSDEAAIAASQVNFTASDIGGVTVSITATQPPDPSVGDLWYDAENGYVLKQWTGVNWAPYQWGTQAIAARAVTAELIAANTITAEQMAAGIVYAGIVDATVINAATFTGSVFEGTNWIENSSGSFFYSGTPALGNLIWANVTATGTDTFGNVVYKGSFSYSPSGGATPAFGSGLQSGDLLLGTGNALSGTGGRQPSGVASGGDGLVSLNSGLASLTDAEASIVLRSAQSALTGTIPEAFFVGNIHSTQGTPASPTLITTDLWHAMVLSSGWTLGSGGYAEYRLMPDNTVMIRAENLVPGTLTNGTHLWTIPAGYIPAKASQPVAAIVRSGTAMGTVPRLEVTSTGTVNIEDFEATANALYFSGRYALD